MSSPTEHERGTRTVAGREVRIVQLEWHDGKTSPESWDAYDVETGICLTTPESFDAEPDEDDLLNALLSVTWRAEALVYPAGAVVNVWEGVVIVLADDRDEATKKVLDLIHGLPQYDPRIDPVAEVEDIAPLDDWGPSCTPEEIKVGVTRTDT